MVQEITLSIPQSYSDITLKRWLDLQKEMENYKDDQDAVNALILYHLCGLDIQWVGGLEIGAYESIINDLNQFLNDTDLPLHQFITIDGVEYGFEPNLSTMTYGAFVDITKFETFTIDKNWSKIMNILYRPVIKKSGDMYQIEPYKVNDDHEKWLSVGMDKHFGALFFFLHLSIDLFNSTLKSMKTEELPPNIKSALEKSGNLINRFMSWQVETSRSSVKL